MSCAPFRNPLVVALDMDQPSRAIEMASEFGERVGGIKIGPRLALRGGKSFLKEISEIAPLFLDCKFYDIPSVVEESLRAAFECGVSVATIHALSGSESMQRAAALEKELSTVRVLAVTILTSYSQETLPSPLKSVAIADHVKNLAGDIQASGLSSLVCAASDIAGFREALSEEFFYLCPGIRMPEDAKGDQSRVVTPESAIELGASTIVVGRPIVAAADPRGRFDDFCTALRIP